MESLESQFAVVALAMVGMGIGGWIGIGAAMLLFKGRFKVAAAAVFAIGGIAAAVALSPLVMPTPWAEQALARAEEHDPVIQLALREDPAQHGQFLRQLREAQQRGGEAGVAKEMRHIAFEVMSVHGTRLIPDASDQAVDDYVSANADYFAAIHETDPEMCYVYLAEASHGSDYGMSPELYRRMFDAMTAIVTSATRDPHPMTESERAAASRDFTALWTGITEGPGAEALYMGDFDDEPATTPEQRKGLCLFFHRFYQQAAALDRPLRAHVIKAFYE